MDIKEFQRKRGLVPDGIVGKNTIKAFKQEYNLNNEEVAHFLGQTFIESAGFTQVVENLNYSAQALADTWPSRYAVQPNSIKKVPNSLAKSIERDPEKIANATYSNRMGNGTEASGDGWKHRGMGYIQLTGKSIQEEFSDYVKDSRIKEDPGIIAREYEIESAIFYFRRHNLFRGLDKVDYSTIKTLTKKINGGYNHLMRRKSKTEHFYREALRS